MLFPHDVVEAVASGEGNWMDKFLEQVADSSDAGVTITQEELGAFADWHRGEAIVESWNSTLGELSGDNLDLLFPRQYAHIQRFRRLVEKADRLKSLTRWVISESDHVEKFCNQATFKAIRGRNTVLRTPRHTQENVLQR